MFLPYVATGHDQAWEKKANIMKRKSTRPMRNNVSDGRKGKGFKVFETIQRNNPKAMDTMASIY